MAKSHRINFDDLKARADFRAVLLHYGLTLVGSGDQAKVTCPFHDDERPSCSVNLSKGLFHCFACHVTGNVLDFVHRMETRDGETVSLRQAGLRLAEMCDIGTVGTHGGQEPRRASKGTGTGVGMGTKTDGAQRPPARHNRPSTSEAAPTRNKPLGFQLTLAADHPYLSERGLSPELIKRFGLGFCDQGSMAGRCCIPIENAAGELVAYAGRFVGDELPAGDEKYKLPKGFHKSLELFNLHRVKDCRHVVVVEGFFDAIRLHGDRVPAVALMGTSISTEQVALLRDHCPALRFVTVMFDGDQAGRTAAPEIAARLARHWWVRIIELPEGSEPDTLPHAELLAFLGKGDS